MIKIKPPFETVVTENTKWLLRYIRQKVRNPSLAEDLLQETFLKAFRNYDNYVEIGKMKSWLMRIAANTINNNFTGKNAMTNIVVSFDDYDYNLTDTLFDDSDSLDDIIGHDETVRQIMNIINTLNSRDREIMYYRYIYDMSVEATSEKLGIPQGTVKSRTHNTITKIQKQLGVDITPKMKGVHTMKCNEAYKYLLMYAKGTISSENKQLIENHMAECQECADIVTALKNLIPHIKYAQDDEMTHFNIFIKGVMYSTMKSPINSCEITFGYNNEAYFRVLSLSDNNGNELPFCEKQIEDDNKYRSVHIKLDENTPNPLEQNSVYKSDDGLTYKQTKESPNLYTIEYNNYFGNPVYTSLFVIVPKEATNIRIKRGNGVIDCGTYKFVYARRYTSENEGIHLEATFNM